MLNDAVMAPDQKTQTKDLFMPVLLILAKAELMGRPGLSTQELRTALMQTIVPSERDLEVTPSDDVSRVERQMRNLVSHRTLFNQGLVQQHRAKEGQFPPLLISLTDGGRAWLLDQWMKTIELSAVDPDPSSPRQAFESKLTDLAIVVIAHLHSTGVESVTTQQLRAGIRRILPQLHPDDVAAKNAELPWETPLDRAVRNLISHNTLSQKGWVRRNEKGLSLTMEGRNKVLRELLDMVPNPPIKPADADPAPATSRPRM